MSENVEEAKMSDAEWEFIITNLGTRLRAARKAKGLTQRALAEQARISVKYISDIERGRKLPSIATMVTLADVLGGSLDHLLGMPEFEALMEDRPDIAEFLSALRKLPEKMIPFVEDVIESMERHGLLDELGGTC